MNLKNWPKYGSVAAVSLAALFSGCGTEGAENGAAITQNEASRFPAFTVKDLAGNTVTQDIFAQKKITVVNIWGTFCPPCIGEMPELGEWAKNMPEDAQLIGIVCDVESEGDKETPKAAQRILAESKADFVNLLPFSGLADYLENVQAVPTTIFVDSRGNILGEPVVGADVARYKQRVAEYLK